MLSRIAAVGILVTTLGWGQAAQEFPPDEIQVYKKDPKGDLELHIFKPYGWQPSDERAAIVFFFGGGWVGGTPSQFYPHARHFADNGMLAISAQYRTKRSHGTDPFACVEDGKSAVRWVRAHAGGLGVDPKRVVAGGGSAGGHVAASTATLLHLPNRGEDGAISSVPNVLLLFNPVIDTTVRGYGAEKLDARAVVASPAHYVRAGTPPAMIFHGTADTTVPFENVERFYRKMKQHGNRCELIPYEGKPHGFFNYSRDKEIYADTIQRADGFLRSLGFLD
ncbi:MAG: alpha/beta hydrolase [bacterium]|nr:alpha/beta hydrolase [bacterium]